MIVTSCTFPDAQSNRWPAIHRWTGRTSWPIPPGSRVGVRMAIDKESSGLPEMDLRRRTTKVNLWMIVAVALFFVFTGVLVLFYAR